MNFAFVIDNRRCIGCHACTTACKAENSVPLGVQRTWVKYVEKGAFPDTRRYFQVTRCNHCEKPPCVPICPTTAMFQRSDGIVEFDSEACIGCKACLQACPYDAIHIDPDSGTAAKCHFCAHRTDVGLEPACVVVCPVHAILAGDLDDPRSEVARAVSLERVAVRKPEKGTKPKLFYIEAEGSALLPMLAAQDAGYLWAEQPASGAGGFDDWRGPIQIGKGRMAGALLASAPASVPRETYNAPQRIPWHWQVPAYLVTKAVGAGFLILAAAGTALGLLPATPLFRTVAPLWAILLIAVTTGLLVWDLDRPGRFWKILTRPQWRSWLTRGAVVLIAFSGVAAFYWFANVTGRESLARVLAWPAVALGVLAAVYTAFLFAQAQGRDLWQSPLLSTHLLVQSVMAGAAGFLLIGPFAGLDAATARTIRLVFAASLGADFLVTAAGELGLPHASMAASTASRMITRGRYAPHFWGSLAGGILLPLAILALAPASPPALAAAGVLALAGLFSYEWAFVFAPQQVPNN
jgi:Fe-S-cluster-containing dehydrogenase component/formate-dependent nitrite reductase membrane component NrfD